MIYEIKLAKIIDKHDRVIQHAYCNGLYETLLITECEYLNIFYPFLFKELKIVIHNREDIDEKS